MVTRGNSTVSMKFDSGEVHEIGFVSFPKAGGTSSAYEDLNTEMVYLYVDGILSGAVQRGISDTIYQTDPQNIVMGSPDATLDIFNLRAYRGYLTDSQMLDLFILNQETVDDVVRIYEENNIIDENGNVSVASVPDDMRYIIVTGKQPNGVPTILQAANNNNKDTRYDVDEMLVIKRSQPQLNFKLIGGCIRLQGTSSLAYPIKNYRIYLRDSNKVDGQMYLGCNEQGVGGTLQTKAKYSFRVESPRPVPVNCFCLKSDFAESSSSHNTGLAKLAQNVLTAANDLVPPQKYVNKSVYNYDVRTTVDGEPCLLFYRGSVEDTPVLLGKFNWNNDKSTEDVFGFLDIPGYHDQPWVDTKFGGNNPTECWEFLNNDYPMGSFLDDDFDTKGEDGIPNWLKVFEARFPDDDDINEQYKAGTLKPYYLERLVKWIKSTENNPTKFRNEVSNYFDINYLCDYYMFTDIFGAVDQRVKNMMLAFWYSPDADKVLAYMIFYDNDTILGVRNDGRLKYNWDITENTVDPELSTPEKTVYAYAGHNSVLWKNLRSQFPNELEASYKRVRNRMTNDTIFNMFDIEQSSKYCQRLYNLDALNKYVSPKTLGIDINQNGVINNVKYSYLEASRGSRKTHRHWWVINRMELFDAKFSTGQYSSTDITWKGNSAPGAVIKVVPSRDFYFEFRREGTTMVHSAVTKDVEWSYTYDQTANIGTIFHLLGGLWMKKIDFSGWNGFTDINIPRLPSLEELVLGATTQNSLSEISLTDKLPMLKILRMPNYVNIPSMNLSSCRRLEYVDFRGCTRLANIEFAEGSPVNEIRLENSGIDILKLKSLPNITRSKLYFPVASITGLNIENCALLDGYALFNEVFTTPSNLLKNVRINVGKINGNGSDLQQYYNANLGGIDIEGNIVANKCKLIGTYILSSEVDETTLNNWRNRFDELNIIPSKTEIIEFDLTVADPANISNLSNSTGYKFGTAYQPSYHIRQIANKRHRYLAKRTGSTITSIAQLDDKNSNFYVGGTPALLDGTQGEVVIKEPHYWYKGVNDLIAKKQYHCYSSNVEKPKSEPVTIITNLGSITYQSGKRLLTSKTTNTYQIVDYTYDDYRVCRVDISGYKKVRFQPSNSYYESSSNDMTDGYVILDASNNVLVSSKIYDPTTPNTGGRYFVENVPTNGKYLLFSVKYNGTGNGEKFDKVVLSHSDNIIDIEPDWIEHKECLVSVFANTTHNGVLKSIATNTLPTYEYFDLVNTGYKEFISYDIWKDIHNLSMAYTGSRAYDYGYPTRQFLYPPLNAGSMESGDIVYYVGGSSIIGMRSTKPGSTANYVLYEDTDGLKNIQYRNFMGYESLDSNIFHFKDNIPTNLGSGVIGVDRPNSSTKGILVNFANRVYAAKTVYNELYMDILSPSSGATNANNYKIRLWDVYQNSGNYRLLLNSGTGPEPYKYIELETVDCVSTSSGKRKISSLTTYSGNISLVDPTTFKTLTEI